MDEETESEGMQEINFEPTAFFNSMLSGQEEVDPNFKRSCFLIKDYSNYGSRQTYV